MAFDLENIVRRNIAGLEPYSSARSEFVGQAEVYLDANENAHGSPAGSVYNRYPDPLQRELKKTIAHMEGIPPDEIFLGNGSDEAIDLLFRIFCEPGRSDCIICPPTYGMYRVSAQTNDVGIREINLTEEFQLDTDNILNAIAESTRLIFVCSPNNPTGNLMNRNDILRIADEFDGILVVDEAYIDFASSESMLLEMKHLPNLVVLRTFSKAWGMAGLRVGMAFADRTIIELMNRVKPPYNISAIAQTEILKAMESKGLVENWIAETLSERERLASEFSAIKLVERVFPSDANFLLVKVTDASEIYRHLVEEGIVVRDRSNVALCGQCLRITVGTPQENDRLIRALNGYVPMKNGEEIWPHLFGGI
jgi:histidinol-phosphate aminotransferase